MNGVALKYDYICHIHTKKSSHSTFGDEWRKYLFTCLLGDEDHVKNIIANFEANEKLGLIFPERISYLKHYPNLWGGNYERLLKLLADIKISMKIFDYEPIFPAGNMFWAKAKAIKSIFQRNYNQLDFEEEKSQLDGTLAHAIERSWCYIALGNGFTYLKIASE